MTRFEVVAYSTAKGVRFRVEPLLGQRYPDPRESSRLFRSRRKAERIARQWNEPAPVRLRTMGDVNGS